MYFILWDKIYNYNLLGVPHMYFIMRDKNYYFLPGVPHNGIVGSQGPDQLSEVMERQAEMIRWDIVNTRLDKIRNRPIQRQVQR